MTDEQTKQNDRRKLKIAAAAVAAGFVGNRVTNAVMDYMEPGSIIYPPPATAPKEPGPDAWPNLKHKDDGPKMHIPTPLETVDEPKWVKSNNQEKGKIV